MSVDNLGIATACPICGNTLLRWRSRTRQRVCQRCYPDPLEGLRGPLEEIAGPYQLTVAERQ
jgi:hypothetical protein